MTDQPRRYQGSYVDKDGVQQILNTDDFEEYKRAIHGCQHGVFTAATIAEAELRCLTKDAPK